MKSYHVFKRIMPDGTKFDIKALVKVPRGPVTIELTEKHVLEAIERNGYADGANCAGAVCCTSPETAKLFSHKVTALVDWWRRRAYLHAGHADKKGNTPVCYVYAHEDKVEALFDGNQSDLMKLLRRVKKSGAIKINLYPVKRGRHPVTGKPTRPSGPGSTSGQHRPRRRGNDLRLFNHASAKGA